MKLQKKLKPKKTKKKPAAEVQAVQAAAAGKEIPTATT